MNGMFQCAYLIDSIWNPEGQFSVPHAKREMQSQQKSKIIGSS